MVASDKRKSHDMVGAVLVIGGGIGGIQASLDLAETGQKVYLLERSPAIGGNMARLDKTFPTNDCSMCILSPKIVECGRHPNVDILTWSELESLAGSAGHFKAKVRRRARYVDMAKCTGCGECAKECPVIVANEFDGGLGERRAIFRPYPQSYPNAFVIDKRLRAPCRQACPAGVNVQGFIALMARGKFDEALELYRTKNPFPASCGRICDHPCQAACNRGCLDEPLAIRDLHRFLADREIEAARRGARPEITPEIEERRKAQFARRGNGRKVAIVGSGPAGLSCAWNLALMEYKPVVFESLPVAGGMLRVGVPCYRLPVEVLDYEIEAIRRAGVEIRLNTPVGPGRTLNDLFAQGFESVFVAIGAHRSRRLGVEGEDLEGVIHGTEFLRLAKTARPAETAGRRVVVVGGGNTAIDAARVALRLGAKRVMIVYRRGRAEMPARAEEIEACEREGVEFRFLVNPVRILGADGKVGSLECVRMALGEPDASGRRRPVPIPGSNSVIEAEIVIPAVGEEADIDALQAAGGAPAARAGLLAADPDTLETSIQRVFAGGDVVSGPNVAIEAIAAGQRAATSIDRCLNGEDLRAGRGDLRSRPDAAELAPVPPAPVRREPRVPMAVLPAEERLGSFAEVERGYTEEEALREAGRCLHCTVCSECLRCAAVCKAGAIRHGDRDVVEDLDVGAVVVLPGFEEFTSRLDYDYGYSRYPDVVSSMEFERILSASGPFGGHVQRPSDGKVPRRIAFLQCVGSRDVSCRNAYCSSVCCMYAIKEAVIAKEHVKGMDVTIFFMDMRAFGKDFDRYYERAKSEYGVRFVRARVSDVFRKNGDGVLTLKYADESGGVSEADFDLVVLSVGLEPAAGMRVLAEKLGVRTTPHGFIWTEPGHPLKTSRPGILVGGPASGPKDIPETVVQAGGAACEASVLLAGARGTLTAEREFPPERDVGAEPARVGVFVCHCGINIGGVVDVPGVTEYAKSLSGVAYAENNLYTCSQDTQDHIRETIREHRLNRVVVASCSPRTHEPLFQQTLREAGLNRHLFEMANIRDQCSWIHMNLPAEATAKAKDLVRMAVAKALLAEPLRAARVPVTPAALVIGGGLAGMTAALAVADQGFRATLVERDRELGGNLRRLRRAAGGMDVPAYLRDLAGRVAAHPNIEVLTASVVADVKGFVGNFESTIRSKSRTRTVKHGVAIVATGGTESRPAEYRFGKDRRVMTQMEMEERLAGRDPLAGVKTVVMIQCVGSREKEHPYCSRVCCGAAVKNAIRIKEASRETQVYVLYRDMRTYGLAEEDYRRARDLGVLFVRYDLDRKPVATNVDGLRVTVREPILDAEMALETDWLVLSSRVDPDAENAKLAQMLKVPLNEDGFFVEAHVKLRPVEFATEGVFVAGLAHGPKNAHETLAQALAAASRAGTVLNKAEIETEATIAEVRPERCAACGLCETVCAYHAVTLELQRVGKEERMCAVVNPALCKGCGACAAGCRSGAINLRGFTDLQILAEIAQL
jgi:heterodisulfide reductase subunit A-like polyferredoxin/NADPH-dependent glutamate synthase beta subunit-like oxidoreductase